ncbi:hypothetical protein DRJ48_00845 [Candidatus Woesearchaeota archaeon]|nr:hypothetical protein [Candidatus Woesearchaeota archaeon]RLE43487.1 MAG: hypothetical protein DRJ48_00845 [Candidatus Woesearchaeota archaeon]
MAKRVWFAIAIALLYIPLIFLGVNTFFPEIKDTCSQRAAMVVCPPTENQTQGCVTNRSTKIANFQGCYETQRAEREQQNKAKYIAIISICILTWLFILRSKQWSIRYGLFAGVLVTALLATIIYIQNRSIIGFILLLMLFLFVIRFVEKEATKSYKG